MILSKEVLYLQNTQTVYKICIKYEKDQKSVNTRSNLYIWILILNEPAGSQEVYMVHGN